MFHRGTSGYGYVIPTTLTSLGIRFARASWYAELDSSMKYTIDVCRRLLVHFEMATTPPNVVMPTDNDLYITLKHHLLSLHYAPRNDDLNEPLRCSLFIYTYLRVSHFGSFPAMRYIVDGLRQSLVPRLAYFKVTAPDLLFWILFIGGMASQGHVSHPWFMVNLRDLAEEWDKARLVLGEFFYTDQHGHKEAEDLWNKMLVPLHPYIATEMPSSSHQIHQTN
jgi:hypothetical protein